MVIVSSFHFNIHLTISLADMEGKERGSIKSRKTEKHSFANTQASCDHGSEKGTVLQNFPFIMNSQAQQTPRWHTQPGCFWSLVKQTGPTGWLCSVIVAGFGSLCWNAADFSKWVRRGGSASHGHREQHRGWLSPETMLRISRRKRQGQTWKNVKW